MWKEAGEGGEEKKFKIDISLSDKGFLRPEIIRFGVETQVRSPTTERV